MYKLKNKPISSDVEMNIVRGAQIADNGVTFGFYAPAAESVYVTGSFNGWSESDPMTAVGDGTWTAHVTASVGDTYKYKVLENGRTVYFTDPYSRLVEHFGYHDSVICDSKMCEWSDEAWQKRGARSELDKRPLNIYVADLCVWQQCVGFCSDFACELIPYLKQMSYTHVELSGVLEHFYDFALERESVAAFAPRFELGSPSVFAGLIDALHVNGIGAILDISELDGADAEAVADCIEFWISEYHFDGISLTEDMLKRSAFKLRALKELRNVMFLLKIPESGRLSDAYITDAFTACGTSDGTCVGEAKRIELSDSFSGVCSADTKRAMLAYCGSIFETGKKLTYMGDELGSRLDRAFSEQDVGARLQLLCADVNCIYLSYSQLWQNDGYRSLYRSDSASFILRTHGGKNALLAFFNRSDESSLSVAVKPCIFASLDEIFDSESRRYGGEHEAGIRYSTGESIELPPLSVKIFELNGQYGAEDIQIEIK